MKTKILCPDCGKLLLCADDNTTGIIYAWCKRCKDEKAVQMPQNIKKEYLH